MARTALTVNTINRTGIAPATPVAGDVTNGNVVNRNDGRIWIEAKNTGASSRTVTVTLTKKTDGQTPAAKVYTLAAGAERRIGPWPTEYYSSDLQIDVAHAEVTLAAYTLSDR